MKKAYQAPQIVVAILKPQRFLSVSPTGYNRTLNGEGGEGGNALSRGGFCDDDE